MKEIAMLAFLAALSICVFPAHSTTLTVGGDGANYTSIQAAIDAAVPGDLILVTAGIYRENVVVTKSLVLHGLGWPVVDAGGEYPLGPAITVEADGVVVEGFEAINSTNTPGDPNAGAGIRIKANSSIIRNNLIQRNYRSGIALYSGYNNTIDENNVSGSYDGITIFSGRNNVISNNYIHNNAGDGIVLGVKIPLCSSNNSLVNNTIIENYQGICIRCSIDDLAVNNTISSM